MLRQRADSTPGPGVVTLACALLDAPVVAALGIA
jgi:hypothetical protein